MARCLLSEIRSTRRSRRAWTLPVYTSPDELRRSMQDFIAYYNHRRYHEAIGNVTPADVYYEQRKEPYAEGPNRNNARLSRGCPLIRRK